VGSPLSAEGIYQFNNTQQQCQLQGYLEELGEGASQIQDDTQPDLQDEDIMEVVLVVGHLFISLVWPTEHRDLPAVLGDRVGPTGQ